MAFIIFNFSFFFRLQKLSTFHNKLNCCKNRLFWPKHTMQHSLDKYRYLEQRSPSSVIRSPVYFRVFILYVCNQVGIDFASTGDGHIIKPSEPIWKVKFLRVYICFLNAQLTGYLSYLNVGLSKLQITPTTLM